VLLWSYTKILTSQLFICLRICFSPYHVMCFLQMCTIFIFLFLTLHCRERFITLLVDCLVYLMFTEPVDSVLFVGGDGRIGRNS